MNYYYADANNQPQGPVTAAQLQAMLQTGQVHGGTLVAAEGTQNWGSIYSVVGPPVRTPALHPAPHGHHPHPAARHHGPVHHGPVHHGPVHHGPVHHGPVHHGAHHPPQAHGHHGHPAAHHHHPGPQRGSRMIPLYRRGGLLRLGYFFWLLSVGLLVWGSVAFLLSAVAQTPSEKTLADGAKQVEYSGHGAYWVLFWLAIVGGAAAAAGAAASRLNNIGWNPWLCLLTFAPIVNVWIVSSCIALPPGYGQTSRMDLAGKILSGFLAAFWIIVAISTFMHYGTR